MASNGTKVICPHCGAENPKSLIVTTCLKCLGSLERAQPAPVEPVAQAPAPRPAPRLAARKPAAPPTRAPVMPPEPTAPPQPVAAEKGPEPLPARPPADASILPPPVPPTPPASEPAARTPRAPYQPLASELVGEVERLARELRRSSLGLGTRRPSWALDPEEHKGVLLGVAAVVAGIAVFMFVGGEPSLLRALVVLGIGGVVAVLVARAFVAATTYEVIAYPPPSFAVLGQTFTWGVSLRVRKAFVLQSGRIVVRCQEHVVQGSGKSRSHRRHTIYEQTYRIPPQPFGPGQTADLTADISIPASAIPSYPDRRNSIEWTVSLQAPVEGFCPDIKAKTELRVVAVVDPHGDTGADGSPSVPAKWLESAAARSRVGAVQDGPLSAMVWPADGRMPHALPVVAAGETREFNLTLRSLEDINCRGVRCWIGCRSRARGAEEEVVVSKDVLVHQGALRAGQTLNLPLSVRIPPSGPVTYAGHYVNFEWIVRVSLDIPLWWDRQVEVPFVVAPRLLQAGEREPAAAVEASTPSAPPS